MPRLLPVGFGWWTESAESPLGRSRKGRASQTRIGELVNGDIAAGEVTTRGIPVTHTNGEGVGGAGSAIISYIDPEADLLPGLIGGLGRSADGAVIAAEHDAGDLGGREGQREVGIAEIKHSFWFQAFSHSVTHTCDGEAGLIALSFNRALTVQV